MVLQQICKLYKIGLDGTSVSKRVDPVESGLAWPPSLMLDCRKLRRVTLVAGLKTVKTFGILQKILFQLGAFGL